MLLWILLFTLISVKIVQILWQRRKLYATSFKLPGDFALPLIGNGTYFICKHEEIFGRCVDYVNKYKSPCRIWLGTNLAVLFSEPSDVEKILTSSKYNYKHDLYKFLFPVVGTSLISGSGPRYKADKKAIQPFINLQFITNNLDVIHKNINIFVNNLKQHANDNKTFDIEPIVHLCFADIFANIFLGWDLRAQFGENHEFMHHVSSVYAIFYERIVKPWEQNDLIYKFMNNYEKMKTSVKTMHDILNKLIKNGPTKKANELYSPPIIKHLIELADDGKIVPNDIKFHALTLYMASEDTATLMISFVCVCLGIHKNYQQKAYKEVCEVFGDNIENATMENINELKYVEMCIKEVLRLFPIAPFILRQNMEENQIGDIKYPPGCALIIAIYNLHTNPKFWENPKDFHPDHFLQENIDKRPAYAFLPFSAGPRMCIGKPLAYTTLKLCLSYILLNYEIEADGRVEDLRLRADISVRAIDGYNIRLKKRTAKINQ